MAACKMMQVLQTSQLPYSSSLAQDRSCCMRVRGRKTRHCGLSSSFWRLSSRSLWICTHGNLTYACSRSSTVWVTVMENLPGRVNTAVDLGIQVSDLEFFPDILDIQYRENNRTAPPAVPHYPPSDGYGPSELDFEIYASNSMEGYEPPPPPRIPFASPFEDYYDEAIGVDYISKDKPVSSLLRFLESLNAKKAEEDGSNASKPLFGQRLLNPAETAEDEPGIPHTTYEDEAEGVLDTDKDEQASIGIDLSSTEAKASFNQSALFSNLAAKDSLEDLSNSSHMSTDEQIFAKPSNDHINMAPESQHAPSATVPTQVVGDSRKPSFFQTGITNQARAKRVPSSLQNEISEELKARDTSSSTSSRVADDTRIEDRVSSSQSSSLSEKVGDGSTALSIGPAQNIEVELAEQIEGNTRRALVQKGFSSQAQKSDIEVTRYYEPREGDLVLGAISFINDQKADLEIGAELAALMPLRDLQALSQNVEKMLHEVPPSKDALDVSRGESLLVKDTAAFDCVTSNKAVDIGTVVLAEVVGRTIIDGRAILSCKSLAQRLARHRIEQQCPVPLMNNS